MTGMAYLHAVYGGGASGYPSIDSLCPFGGTETLYRWLASGDFLRRTAPSALILFGIVGVMTLLLGRVFCGWICPLGAVGEFFAWLGRKLRIPTLRVPDGLDGLLKGVKYLVLLGILIWTVSAGTLAWRDYDPWVAWAHLAEGWSGVLSRPWAYVALLSTVMLGSLFVERLWCRYLCPLGAALGLAAVFSPLRVGKGAENECTSCGVCVKACPVQLYPERGNVPSSECLVCGKCIDIAPSRCAVRARMKKRTISLTVVGGLTLLLFFGGYAVAKGTGYWNTFVPPKVTAGMTPEQIADSVFGWMSLKQASETTGIPVDKIKQQAKLDANVSETESMKTLGIDDEAVKEAIREIASGPETTVPQEASADVRPPAPTLPNPMEIKGTQTLLDLKGVYGLEPATILGEAGWPTDLSADVPLRELKSVTGQEVDAIRQAVKRLLP